MARYSPQDRSAIDRLVDRWREYSLLSDASFLRPDLAPECWSASNTQNLYDRFIGNPLLGSDGGGTFPSKWQLQLQDATPEVRLLAGECLTIYYLFTSTVGYDRKFEMVNATIDTPDWLISDSDADLHEAFENWVANPGSRYNTRQDRQIAYLIEFCRRFKALDVSQRRDLLEDNPWEFMEFADDTEELPDAMRHVVCHLLYPDYFERISSPQHKRQIVSAFSALSDTTDDESIDQRLYGIRQKLTQQMPGAEEQRDFYSPELEPIWRPAKVETSEVSPLSALLRKKQIIFYGPPGTGKTYTAQRLAETLIRSSAIQRWGVEAYYAKQPVVDDLLESHVTRLQLHPGIGYAEFIAGLQLGDGGQTQYKPGILLDLIHKMHHEPSNGLAKLPQVLILDEVNRTDLSSMLGEAFSAMEVDKRGIPVKLPATDSYGENLTLTMPEDLYIIGTMNEIDHSVESLDFALRRRFLWFHAPFDADALRIIWQHEWEEQRPRPRVSYEQAEDQLEQLIENIELLNQEITNTPDLGSAYEIGHAFFSDLAFLVTETFSGRRPPNGTILWTRKGNPQPPLSSIWAFSIRPLLEQYLAGSDMQQSILESFRTILMEPPVNR